MDLSKVTNMQDSNQFTRAYLDSLLIETRYIDSRTPNMAMNLYGKTFSSPVMTAALSHLHGVHPQGMVELAAAAKEADICCWIGMGDEAELKAVRGTGAEVIKIIKPYADRELVYQQLAEAEAAGALAVGMDIDHSFNRQGQPDVVAGIPMHPVARGELQSFVQATRLPFIVKGVLSVQDAVRAAEAGARGLVISHHHGIPPCAIPPLMALPAIADALSGQVDLFVDCGIESGMDVFKCLAMGAKAVSVGRALMAGLKEKGWAGVTENIRRIREELCFAMALTGSPALEYIPRDVLWSASLEKRCR